MKIIKRSGEEVVFNGDKIVAAIEIRKFGRFATTLTSPDATHNRTGCTISTVKDVVSSCNKAENSALIRMQVRIRPMARLVRLRIMEDANLKAAMPTYGLIDVAETE